MGSPLDAIKWHAFYMTIDPIEDLFAELTGFPKCN